MAVEFTYAQARAQARHGDRLTPADWRMLESSASLSQYLHVARGTALGPRLRHYTATTSPHAIEQSLRQDWRGEVDGVARWLPPRWRPSVRWTRWLPDLPSLTYLLRGGPIPAWMGRDPTLARLAVADVDDRIGEFNRAEPGRMVARYGVDDLAGAWVRHWRRLWPKENLSCAALDELVKIVAADLASSRPPGPDSYGLLEAHTTRLMRRNTSQPVVVFCHLLLTALELYRLRYGLIQRALLNDATPVAPA